MLTVRIERLPAPAKRLLQTAAVLGRDFSLRVLTTIWQQPVDIHRTLVELQQAEFLYEHGGQEPLYRFKHMLTHDVAYESLSASQRMALHAVTAQALETLYAERLEEVAERLAQHYAQTDYADKAITSTPTRSSRIGCVSVRKSDGVDAPVASRSRASICLAEESGWKAAFCVT